MKKFISILSLSIFFCHHVNAQNYYRAGRQVTSLTIANQLNSASSNCDTIFSFPTDLSNDFPTGLTYEPKGFWTSDGNYNLLYNYSLTGQLIRTLNGPPSSSGYGGDMDYSGGYLWHVVEQEAMLYKIDTVNGNVLAQINLPSTHPLNDPNNWGCAFENGYIWTTEYVDGTLMRINATTRVVVDSFVVNRRILPVKVIKGQLYGIGLDNNLVGTMYHFDKTNGAILDSIPWCLEYSLGLCEANEHIWGLSSFAYTGVGTKRIYEFDNLILSNPELLNDNSSVSVYPNPVSNELNINLNKNDYEKNYELIVYDLLGRERNRFQIRTALNKFTLEHLAPGIYVYELMNEDGILSNGKFIKE